METSIYQLILFNNPQALIILDDYQFKHYDRHIVIVPEEDIMHISYEYEDETLNEINREMRKAPSRSRD